MPYFTVFSTLSVSCFCFHVLFLWQSPRLKQHYSYIICRKTSPRLLSVRFFIRGLFGEVFHPNSQSLYGNTIFVVLGGTQTWWPASNRNICHCGVLLFKRKVIILELRSIEINTFSREWAAQFAKTLRDNITRASPGRRLMSRSD